MARNDRRVFARTAQRTKRININRMKMLIGGGNL